jgi:hypothetical protein
MIYSKKKIIPVPLFPLGTELGYNLQVSGRSLRKLSYFGGGGFELRSNYVTSGNSMDFYPMDDHI